MVVLYSWSGVRDISWSRVRVRVLACCGVMVIVFTRSYSVTGMMLQVLMSQDVWLLWYFIDGQMSGLSHGLGLGLGFSHIVELWLLCLQGPSLSLGRC